MSPEDICGPYPAASNYADKYVDANGATIYSPLTPAQNAQYLADVSKYQQCLAAVQGTPQCPVGQYFAGSLAGDNWLGHCVSDYTGQPTTPDTVIPVADVPTMTPIVPVYTPVVTPPTTPPATKPTSPPPTTPTKPTTPTTPTTTPTAAPSIGHGLQAHYVDPGDPGIGSYCDLFPDDPLCNLWWTFPTGGTPTTTQVVNVTQQVGLLAGDVHQIVNDALTGLWDVLTGTLDLVLAGIFSQIQNALTAIGNALKAAWNILSRLGGMILTFLQHMWYNVLHGLVLAVQDVAGALKAVYDDVLKPLLGWLQKIRQKILDIWKRFVVPLLIIIQDIRRVLAILGAFHIKFAQKLDQKLAQLEGKITQPLLLVLGMVNSVANWLNLIVTAGYLLQRPMFLNSLQRYAGAAINLQLNSMGATVDSSAIAAANQRAAFTPAKQSADDLNQFLSSGTGAFADLNTTQGAQLDQYLQGNF